ncbi:MAG: 3-hydroxyacyl-CoA dehydrogenase [Alphaproteobacteria bacterium]|nr:3-hydroxyacyl-CoA dehydrogenase [Alphaproteobacteria bacterium]
MPDKVGLIGAGLIGRGWAIVFARAGYEVALFDARAESVREALDWVSPALADMQNAGLIEHARPIEVRIRGSASLAEAVAGAVYVQESVTEDRAVKNATFQAMARVAAPEAVLASSCASIPPSSFLADVPGRERCLIAHPCNPPHLIPVVEVVTTPWTSERTLTRGWTMLEQIGQVPVRINKEITGFALNRLQAAVIGEAMNLVAEGVISPRDLDRCMKNGLGLRWSFMGPFETMDLNAPGGFLDYASKFGEAYQNMTRDLHVKRPWKQRALRAIATWRRGEVPAEHLGERRAWRDRNLMTVGRLLRGGRHP